MKYHFHSDQGIRNLTQEAANKIAGEDSDFHRRDLYEAIEDGDFPSWTLHVQVMPFEDAKTYRFNPFDLTKIWPHSDYPLIKVGKMTLNKNPENFFAADRAGRVRAERGRAGHRVQPRQDAARPGVLLRRHAPLPHRPELPAAAGEQAPRRGRVHLPVRRPDGLRPRGRPLEVRPELLRRRLQRRARRRRGQLGDRRRDGPHGLHAARGRRRLRPGRHAGPRGLGRRRARALRRQRRRSHPRRREATQTLPRVFEYWKNVDAETGKRIEEAVQAGQDEKAPAPGPTEREGVIEETPRSTAG